MIRLSKALFFRIKKALTLNSHLLAAKSKFQDYPLRRMTCTEDYPHGDFQLKFEEHDCTLTPFRGDFLSLLLKDLDSSQVRLHFNSHYFPCSASLSK
ncbi:hypothetical protein L6164_028231 [Bauhinia variegata]|uniref:Uncharacterized protein n=1 Tax=Bauhinia variegata TaxID=167791 RepID=A0ACB9LWS3_BAUVA|nr:hypothetical protein L6164_028231 [Bauhinia variegata]